MPDPTAHLQCLIAEERELVYRDDPDEDDAAYAERVARIHQLRADIALSPVRSLADIVAKAAYVERLYAEAGETLEDAIMSDRHSVSVREQVERSERLVLRCAAGDWGCRCGPMRTALATTGASFATQ